MTLFQILIKGKLVLFVSLIMVTGCQPVELQPISSEIIATGTVGVNPPPTLTAPVTPTPKINTETPTLLLMPTLTATPVPENHTIITDPSLEIHIFSDKPAQIAFLHISGPDIVLLDASGSLVRVIRFSDQLFPLDLYWRSGTINGFIVTTASAEDYQIWKISPIDNHVQMLFEMKREFGITYPQISPDGRWVMYSLWSGEFFYEGASQQDIEVFSINNPSQVFRITRYGGGQLKGGTWSPDGATIAFTDYDEDKNMQLFLSSPDGSSLRQITSNSDPSREIRTVRWSPDGSRLVFDAPGGQEKSNIWMYIIDRDYLYSLLSDIHELTISQGVIWWINDGNDLLFGASAMGASSRGIFVFAAQGGMEGYLPESKLPNEPSWIFPIDDNGSVGFCAGSFIEGFAMDARVFYRWNYTLDTITYFTDSTKWNLYQYPNMAIKVVVAGYP